MEYLIKLAIWIIIGAIGAFFIGWLLSDVDKPQNPDAPLTDIYWQIVGLRKDFRILMFLVAVILLRDIINSWQS